MLCDEDLASSVAAWLGYTFRYTLPADARTTLAVRWAVEGALATVLRLVELNAPEPEPDVVPSQASTNAALAAVLMVSQAWTNHVPAGKLAPVPEMVLMGQDRLEAR
jgi:hypothetical protein